MAQEVASVEVLTDVVEKKEQIEGKSSEDKEKEERFLQGDKEKRTEQPEESTSSKSNEHCVDDNQRNSLNALDGESSNIKIVSEGCEEQQKDSSIPYEKAQETKSTKTLNNENEEDLEQPVEKPQEITNVTSIGVSESGSSELTAEETQSFVESIQSFNVLHEDTKETTNTSSGTTDAVSLENAGLMSSVLTDEVVTELTQPFDTLSEECSPTESSTQPTVLSQETSHKPESGGEFSGIPEQVPDVNALPLESEKSPVESSTQPANNQVKLISSAVEIPIESTTIKNTDSTGTKVASVVAEKNTASASASASDLVPDPDGNCSFVICPETPALDDFPVTDSLDACAEKGPQASGRPLQEKASKSSDSLNSSLLEHLKQVEESILKAAEVSSSEEPGNEDQCSPESVEAALPATPLIQMNQTAMPLRPPLADLQNICVPAENRKDTLDNPVAEKQGNANNQNSVNPNSAMSTLLSELPILHPATSLSADGAQKSALSSASTSTSGAETISNNSVSLENLPPPPPLVPYSCIPSATAQSSPVSTSCAEAAATTSTTTSQSIPSGESREDQLQQLLQQVQALNGPERLLETSALSGINWPVTSTETAPKSARSLVSSTVSEQLPVSIATSTTAQSGQGTAQPTGNNNSTTYANIADKSSNQPAEEDVINIAPIVVAPEGDRSADMEPCNFGSSTPSRSDSTPEEHSTPWYDQYVPPTPSAFGQPIVIAPSGCPERSPSVLPTQQENVPRSAPPSSSSSVSQQNAEPEEDCLITFAKVKDSSPKERKPVLVPLQPTTSSSRSMPLVAQNALVQMAQGLLNPASSETQLGPMMMAPPNTAVSYMSGMPATVNSGTPMQQGMFPPNRPPFDRTQFRAPGPLAPQRPMQRAMTSAQNQRNSPPQPTAAAAPVSQNSIPQNPLSQQNQQHMYASQMHHQIRPQISEQMRQIMELQGMRTQGMRPTQQMQHPHVTSTSTQRQSHPITHDQRYALMRQMQSQMLPQNRPIQPQMISDAPFQGQMPHQLYMQHRMQEPFSSQDRPFQGQVPRPPHSHEMPFQHSSQSGPMPNPHAEHLMRQGTLIRSPFPPVCSASQPMGGASIAQRAPNAVQSGTPMAALASMQNHPSLAGNPQHPIRPNQQDIMMRPPHQHQTNVVQSSWERNLMNRPNGTNMIRPNQGSIPNNQPLTRPMNLAQGAVMTRNPPLSQETHVIRAPAPVLAGSVSSNQQQGPRGRSPTASNPPNQQVTQSRSGNIAVHSTFPVVSHALAQPSPISQRPTTSPNAPSVCQESRAPKKRPSVTNAPNLNALLATETTTSAPSGSSRPVSASPQGPIYQQTNLSVSEITSRLTQPQPTHGPPEIYSFKMRDDKAMEKVLDKTGASNTDDDDVLFVGYEMERKLPWHILVDICYKDSEKNKLTDIAILGGCLACACSPKMMGQELCSPNMWAVNVRGPGHLRKHLIPIIMKVAKYARTDTFWTDTEKFLRKENITAQWHGFCEPPFYINVAFTKCPTLSKNIQSETRPGTSKSPAASATASDARPGSSKSPIKIDGGSGPAATSGNSSVQQSESVKETPQQSTSPVVTSKPSTSSVISSKPSISSPNTKEPTSAPAVARQPPSVVENSSANFQESDDFNQILREVMELKTRGTASAAEKEELSKKLNYLIDHINETEISAKAQDSAPGPSSASQGDTTVSPAPPSAPESATPSEKQSSEVDPKDLLDTPPVTPQENTQSVSVSTTPPNSNLVNASFAMLLQEPIPSTSRISSEQASSPLSEKITGVSAHDNLIENFASAPMDPLASPSNSNQPEYISLGDFLPPDLLDDEKPKSNLSVRSRALLKKINSGPSLVLKVDNMTKSQIARKIWDIKKQCAQVRLKKKRKRRHKNYYDDNDWTAESDDDSDDLPLKRRKRVERKRKRKTLKKAEKTLADLAPHLMSDSEDSPAKNSKGYGDEEYKPTSSEESSSSSSSDDDSQSDSEVYASSRSSDSDDEDDVRVQAKQRRKRIRVLSDSESEEEEKLEPKTSTSTSSVAKKKKMSDKEPPKLNIVAGEQSPEEGVATKNLPRLSNILEEFTTEELWAELRRRTNFFSCSCGMMFHDDPLYYLHRNFHNNDNNLTCNFCHRTLSDYHEFVTHTFEGHTV